MHDTCTTPTGHKIKKNKKLQNSPQCYPQIYNLKRKLITLHFQIAFERTSECFAHQFF